MKRPVNFIHTHAQRNFSNLRTHSLSSYLLVTQVVHPCSHVHSELQQLLGGEGGRGAVLFCKGRIGLQNSTLPQEIKEVTIGGIFNGYVQVTWKGQIRSNNRTVVEEVL